MSPNDPGSDKPADNAVDEMFKRALGGDEEAFRLLHTLCTPFLIRKIRMQYLPPGDSLRAKMDSGDVLQEMWRRVIERLERREEPFGAQVSFMAFLFTVLKSTFRDQCKHLLADKRSPRHEQAADIPAMADPGEGPAEEVEWDDYCDVLLAEFSSQDRNVVEGLLAGSRPREIAEELGLSPRTVQRVIAHLREHWAGGAHGLNRICRGHA